MKFDVVTLAVLIVTIQFASCARESCGDVRRTFVTRSVGPATMVPIMPVTGVGLAVCRSEGPTCCTPAMEAKYREASARDLTDLVKQKTAPLEKRFRIFAKKFREFWNQVVKSSRSRAITAQQNPDLESELRHFYDSFLMPNPVRLASNDDRHVQLDGLLYTVFISSLEDEIGFKLSEEKMGCALSELTRYLTPLTSLKAEIEALLNRTGLFFKALNVGLRAAE
uniref:Secreted protein n=1 Tax=Ciona savignyi TaxID=51511 RepID=H2YE33_CIOSA